MESPKRPYDLEEGKWYRPSPEEDAKGWTLVASNAALVVLAAVAGAGASLGIYYWFVRQFYRDGTRHNNAEFQDQFWRTQVHGLGYRALAGAVLGAAAAIAYLVYAKYQAEKEAEAKKQRERLQGT